MGDIPALIAEGRRLIAENDGKHRYCTMDPGPHAALRMLPALLDVAEAAVRRDRAQDERAACLCPGWNECQHEKEERLAEEALRAAVRGEEKTS